DGFDDLGQRVVAREPGGLTVPAAAEAPRDRRDVELVDARAERSFVAMRAPPHLLTDEDRELGSFDLPEVVDQAFGVRLRRADVCEVRAEEVRNDDPSPFEDLGTLEHAREELELRELDGFVDLLEDGVDVGAGLDELGGEP